MLECFLFRARLLVYGTPVALCACQWLMVALFWEVLEASLGAKHNKKKINFVR